MVSSTHLSCQYLRTVVLMVHLSPALVSLAVIQPVAYQGNLKRKEFSPSSRETGRKLEARTEAEPQKNMAYWIVRHDYLPNFSKQHRTTCPVWHCPQWAGLPCINQQSRKCCTDTPQARAVWVGLQIGSPLLRLLEMYVTLTGRENYRRM